MPTDTEVLGSEVRALVRAAATASLATRRAADGWPYASLVACASDHAGRPLLLLSDLAEHTRNLGAEPRCSLLFDGTAGEDSPLAGARATLFGRAERAADPHLLARFVARHPDAADYAGFADFNLYRLAVAGAHLVAGFGRIHDVAAADVLRAASDSAPLAEAEADILAHMNADHADAVALYATRLAGRSPGAWRMTGIDPEGLDLAAGAARARVAFPDTVATAEQARAALVGLAKSAREAAQTGQRH